MDGWNEWYSDYTVDWMNDKLSSIPCESKRSLSSPELPDLLWDTVSPFTHMPFKVKIDIINP